MSHECRRNIDKIEQRLQEAWEKVTRRQTLRDRISRGEACLQQVPDTGVLQIAVPIHRGPVVTANIDNDLIKRVIETQISRWQAEVDSLGEEVAAVLKPEIDDGEE